MHPAEPGGSAGSPAYGGSRERDRRWRVRGAGGGVWRWSGYVVEGAGRGSCETIVYF